MKSTAMSQTRSIDFLTHIDKTWTLFLDRDGVININKTEGYVLNRHEFLFKEGALEAIYKLSRFFGRIIVITNQRGVGKGLMTEDDLRDIHAYMLQKIECCGGRIDDIFYCTEVDDSHPDRKPNPGLMYKAKEKYPDIDFGKSIFVGDKPDDMECGRTIGAWTVWVASRSYVIEPGDPRVDARFQSLEDFAHYLAYRLKP